MTDDPKYPKTLGNPAGRDAGLATEYSRTPD